MQKYLNSNYLRVAYVVACSHLDNAGPLSALQRTCHCGVSHSPLLVLLLVFDQIGWLILFLVDGYGLPRFRIRFLRWFRASYRLFCFLIIPILHFTPLLCWLLRFRRLLVFYSHCCLLFSSLSRLIVSFVDTHCYLCIDLLLEMISQLLKMEKLFVLNTVAYEEMRTSSCHLIW